MKKTYSMGDTRSRSETKITNKDPFTPLYDDGSYDLTKEFNTEKEAMDFVVQRWKSTTKIVRISELKALEAANV
jgi:hypothetical protein